jgi:response regulator RpfG family c-di-GMP phosphodiesterase
MAETGYTYLAAVLNSIEDVVEALQLILTDAGISSIGAHVVDFRKGRKDILAFWSTYNPKVILFDIAPPLEANWQFFQQVQRATEAQGRQFILTTTNKAALEKLVGKTEAFELLGKPEDLNEIVTAVKKKLQT